jgi:hypothetical protein
MPENRDFHEFSHYAEQTNATLGLLYYYKSREIDHTFLAKRLEDPSTNKQLMEDQGKFVEVQAAAEGMLLRYLGSNPGLPTIKSPLANCELFLSFETFDIDLEFEIAQRVSKGLFFGLEDVWSLIYTGIAVLEVFKRFNESHGNINLHTILVKNYDFKLVYPRLFGLPLVQGPLANGKDYTSDGLLKIKKLKGAPSRKDIWNNDIFSFGLVLLEVCSLRVAITFRLHSGELDLQFINKGLREVNRRYGPEVYTIIREMLILDERCRPDAEQLRKLLTLWSTQMNLTRVAGPVDKQTKKE